MNCPKCNDQQLRLTTTAKTWICPNCHGIWVAEGRALRATPPTLESGTQEVAKELDLRAGRCPEGHGILTRAQTFLDQGFYLERCSTCSGVFFDAGEWQKVAAAGLSAGLFEIWTETWQHEQRLRQSRAAYEDQLNAQLGPELTAQIRGLAKALDEHPSRSLALGLLYSALRSEDPEDLGICKA